MKKNLLLIVMLIGISTYSFGQKFGFVDTDYILENIPEYAQAQAELDELSVEWQKQIETKFKEIDQMYKQYQAESVLLTEEMRRKREDEIIQKEREVKEFQKSKFGAEGDLFKRRQELVKPIQDNIYNAIKDIARAGSYAAIFDKASSQSNLLYASEKFDKSDEVLRKLGYEVGKQ